MRRDTQAKLLTALIGAALVVYVAGERNGWRLPSGAGAANILGGEAPGRKEPRDTIYAMLDAARAGDVEGYLACHAGQMARQLEQSLNEMTAAGFARYLQDRNREIKGVAINEPEMTSEREARLQVEYVYQERNEVQQIYLERLDGTWRIYRVDAAERVKTLVPYGTPVY